MSYTEEQIVYETPSQRYFVLEIGTGHYEVLQNTITHSVRRGIVHFFNDPERARQIAIERCKKLESENIML